MKDGSTLGQSSARTTSPNTSWTLHGDGDGTVSLCKSREASPQFSTSIQRYVSKYCVQTNADIRTSSFIDVAACGIYMNIGYVVVSTEQSMVYCVSIPHCNHSLW